jgi:phospholipid/cholesterol/gamma-HCH transport system substrate-binding protein
VTGSLRSVILKLVVFSTVTLSLTGLLAAVIGNFQPFANFYIVKAEFSDATGLLNTDAVKIAGVTVGKVSGSEVVVDERTGRAKALVTMKVREDVDVPNNARAGIRFRNLLGQRMVVITRDDDRPEAPSFPKNGKARIPLSRTSPAFDLGIVFNNLRPVLQTLNADDVNTVSRAILQIFAGREARVQQLVSDLADVAGSLGNRGPIVTELVTHLSEVASTIAGRDDELRSILGSLETVVATLGDRSEEFARATDNLGVASEGTAQVIANNRPGLDVAIAQLQELLAMLADHRNDLDLALRRLPETAYALNRATTYGEWVNLSVVCINGLCGPGFETDAEQTSARRSPSPSELSDVLLLGMDAPPGAPSEGKSS